MKRKINWQQCLNDQVTAAIERPFLWGQHDCCTFSGDVVKAMTGIDPMAEYRGAYSDEEGARAALEDIGKGTLYRTLQSIFGGARHASTAGRGDLVYITRAEGSTMGPSVGICLGEKSAFVGINQSSDGKAVREGLVFLPTLSCRKTFKV
jgi:Domain of unknown function (DUF6950)